MVSVMKQDKKRAEGFKLEERQDAVTVTQWETPVLASSDQADVYLALTEVCYILVPICAWCSD